MEKGKLKQNGVHLKEHEYKTVKFFLERGIDVELIPTSSIKNLRMLDIMMQGVAWEMKSPEGKGKNTIRNTIQNGEHQSSSLIIGLRRIKVDEKVAIKELEMHFKLSKRIRRLRIITADEELLDYFK